MRRQFNMDALDLGPDPVTVHIPDYIYAISASFFCGMFGDSYDRLGREGLLEKYRLDMPETLRRQVEQGLERCALQDELLKTATV